MRAVRCALIGALLLTACSLRVSGGQQAGSRDDPGDPGAIGRELTLPRVNPDTSVEDQQEKLLRIQRQKRIIADSDKLLKLATDLKQQIDNPAPHALSVDSVKKAAEIEKLAHSLGVRFQQVVHRIENWEAGFAKTQSDQESRWTITSMPD